MKVKIIIIALTLLFPITIKGMLDTIVSRTPLEKEKMENMAISELQQAIDAFIDSLGLKASKYDSLTYEFRYRSEKYGIEEKRIERELNRLISVFDYWQGIANHSFGWNSFYDDTNLRPECITIRYFDNAEKDVNRFFYTDRFEQGRIATFVHNNQLYCFNLSYDFNHSSHEKRGTWFRTDIEIKNIKGRLRNDDTLFRFVAQEPFKSKEDINLLLYDFDFNTLKTRIERLCRTYRNESDYGKKVALSVLYKLSKGYDRSLTNDNVEELKGVLAGLLKSADTKHREVVGYIIALYESKIDSTKYPARLFSMGLPNGFGNDIYGDKFVYYERNDINDNEFIELKVKGKTSRDSKMIILERLHNPFFSSEYELSQAGSSFSIKEKIPHDEIMSIAPNHFDKIYFVNDGKPLRIDLDKRIVKGSDINEKLNEYERTLRVPRLKSIYLKDKSARDSIAQIVNAKQVQAVKDNLDNIISAFYLRQTYPLFDYSELEWFMSDAYPYAKNPILSPVRQHLAARQMRKPGMMFKDFTCIDSEDGKFKLSNFAGRNNYVLLDFRFLRMEHLMTDAKILQRLHDKYSKKGLYIASIWLEQYKAEWLEEIKKHNYGWFLLCDDGFFNAESARAYGVTAVPQNVLIGPDGRIVASDLKEDEIEKTITDIFETKVNNL